MTKVRTELASGIFTITLADPDNRNALSRGLMAEFNAAIDRAEHDDDVRVVVLTNEGTTFCAGADLSEHERASGSEPRAGPAGGLDPSARDP